MQISSDLPHYNEICSILRTYGVSYAGLFGSRVYGDNKPDSDYDILIDFQPGSAITLLTFIELKQKLEKILNSKVDIVTTRSISPYLRESILKNIVLIYGQKN